MGVRHLKLVVPSHDTIVVKKSQTPTEVLTSHRLDMCHLILLPLCHWERWTFCWSREETRDASFEPPEKTEEDFSPEKSYTWCRFWIQSNESSLMPGSLPGGKWNINHSRFHLLVGYLYARVVAKPCFSRDVTSRNPLTTQLAYCYDYCAIVCSS